MARARQLLPAQRCARSAPLPHAAGESGLRTAPTAVVPERHCPRPVAQASASPPNTHWQACWITWAQATRGRMRATGA